MEDTFQLSVSLSLSLALLYTSSDCTNTAKSQGLPINKLEYNSFDYNTPPVAPGSLPNDYYRFVDSL